MQNQLIRPATKSDAKIIAELIAESSSGVAVIEWQETADEQNSTALEIGEAMYQNESGDYSYKNVQIAEIDGQAVGMMLCFAMPKDKQRNPDERPTINSPNVFAPYMYLEEYNSWYVSGVAVYPEFRGQGIGSQFMQLAERQAKENGFSRISLIAFEQNTGSVRLYERLGYRIIDQAPIIPHEKIPYVGAALLMVKDL